MRLEQDQSTHPRLLHKPGPREAPATGGTKVEVKAKKPKGSRFIGPAQLDEERRSHICESLEKKKIGDEIGRQIFIGAVEYQISAFAKQLERSAEAELEPEPEPEPTPPGLSTAVEETLQAIVGNAAGLSSLLRALPEEAKARVTETLAAQDGLDHGYDGRYLCELGLEIDRLGRACIAAASAPAPRKPESRPTPASAVSCELVAKLAEVFSDCFEMEPTADEDGDFYAALKILGEVTGLAIAPGPEILEQVFGARAAKR